MKGGEREGGVPPLFCSVEETRKIPDTLKGNACPPKATPERAQAAARAEVVRQEHRDHADVGGPQHVFQTDFRICTAGSCVFYQHSRPAVLGRRHPRSIGTHGVLDIHGQTGLQRKPDSQERVFGQERVVLHSTSLEGAADVEQTSGNLSAADHRSSHIIEGILVVRRAEAKQDRVQRCGQAPLRRWQRQGRN